MAMQTHLRKTSEHLPLNKPIFSSMGLLAFCHSTASVDVLPQLRQCGSSLPNEHTHIFAIWHKMNEKVFHIVFRLMLLTMGDASHRNLPSQRWVCTPQPSSWSVISKVFKGSSIFFLLCSRNPLRKSCSSKTPVIRMHLAH